jgi:glycosyltransferase involved in cell wall biosynthesis
VEKIVVDRHSEDETVQIAKHFGAKLFDVSLERSTAKNLGARQASGDFLLFADSDMELHPKTIEECVGLCLERDFDAIAIPLTTIAFGFLANCRKLEVELYADDPNSSLMPRFFARKTLLSIDGFDESLVCGEDYDLARRYEKQGYAIGMATFPIKHLEGRLSLKGIVLKAHYYGKTIVPLFSKEPTLALRGYCPTRFAWNARRLLRQPACLAGISMIKLCEYVAYVTGVFTDVLSRNPIIRDRK